MSQDLPDSDLHEQAELDDEGTTRTKAPTSRPAPATEAPEQRRPDDPYLDRLRQIWRQTHGLDPEPNDPQWLIIQAAVLPVVEEEYAGIDRTPLPGSESLLAGASLASSNNVDDANLLLRAQLDRLSDEGVRLLVNEGLAAAVRRFEQAGASRENIADLITQVLPRLPYSSRDPLEMRLLGYLLGQRERNSGFWLTLAVLADYLSESPAGAAKQIALLAYQLVLNGLWNTAREWLPDGDVRDQRALELAGSNSYNMAIDLINDYEFDRSPDDPVTKVIDQLLRISAATSRLAVDTDGIAETLHLPVPGRAGLATLRIAGATQFWSTDHTQRSMLYAGNAIHWATLNDKAFGVSRFFNAGATLLQITERNAPKMVLARLALNLCGLIWGGSTPTDASDTNSIRSSMWSCAVNAHSALADMARSGEGKIDARLRPLAAALAGLPQGNSSLAAEANHSDYERIANSSASLRVAPTYVSDYELLETCLAAAIALGIPGLDADDDLDWTTTLAGIVDWIYREQLGMRWPDVLPFERTQQDREDQVNAFVQLYSAWGEPLFDEDSDPAVHDPGVGPLIAADIVDRAALQRMASAVFAPVDSIAPHLEEIEAPARDR